MQSIWFLVAAYAIVWLVVFGYLWALHRRLEGLLGELQALRASLESEKRPG